MFFARIKTMKFHSIFPIFSTWMRLLSILIFISPNISAVEKEPIAFGNVVIADNRLPLKASDFDVKLNLNESVKTKVILRNDSIQWVRINDVLLTPRGRLAIYIQGDATKFHIRYRGKSIAMQQRKGYAYLEFFVSLFQHDPIEIYKDGKLFGHASFYAKSKPKNTKTTLIDYSCARKGISVEGLDGEYISLGCRIHPAGKFGSEYPILEVYWIAANYRLLDKSEPPYVSVFIKNAPAQISVINHKGERRTLKIEAKLAPRMHRLNVAYGFGPYVFDTTYKKDIFSRTEKLSTPVAPAFMLYFNFKMSDDASIRGFDAAVWKDSSFNNAGVYFANDVSLALDRKLTITTLIGMQYLYFKFDDDTPTINEPIFPQGVEFLYKHAFGIENYIISGGMFLSPSDLYDYQNLWVRWGKNYFWELNYIYWGKEEFTAKMWGLSIGFLWDSYL